MNFNRWVGAGNLTRDPEMRVISTGSAVCNFGIAINRSWTDGRGEKKEETLFVDCECWGRTAETVTQYLHRGSPVLLEGRLKMDTWVDAATGKNRSKLKVLVERFQFVNGPKPVDVTPQFGVVCEDQQDTPF